MSTARGDTSGRILDAARRLLVARGYHGVGLDEVARAAGLSRQALYKHHFRSKGALLLALVARVDDAAGVPEGFARALGQPTALEALDAVVEMTATVDRKIHDIASVLEAARITDRAAATAWEDRMRMRHRGAVEVVRRLAKEKRLGGGWSVAEASDYLFSALSLASYRALVVERGWSMKRYVARMRFVVRAALVEERRRR